MKHTLLLAAVIVLAIGESNLAAASQPKRFNLDGREVVVRVYPDCRLDPEAFEKAVLRTSREHVTFDFKDLGKSAFVVIFGDEQHDELIRKVLGKRVSGWMYKKGLTFELPRTPAGEGDDAYRWSFRDALGNPVSGAEVKTYLVDQEQHVLTALIGTGECDEQGSLTLPFCAGSSHISLGIGGWSTSRVRFVISHSVYGQNVIELGWGKGQKGRVLYIPAVPPDSEAHQRAVRGKVVDPNNKPVSGALVKGIGVRGIGAKPVGRPGQREGVITDQQGRFRMYLPISEDVDRIGTLIPPKAKYSVQIEPPHGSHLAEFKGIIPNDKENVIALEYAGYFRTFEFEDKKGPITNPKVLRDIEVWLTRPGQANDTRWRYDQLKDGGHFPLGKYEAKSWHCGFKRLEVTADSPEKLVFKPKTASIYYGRVVDGTTGEPISEASIRLTTKDWITTDQDGRFEIKVSSNTLIRVSKEEYLEVRVLNSWIKKDRQGRYELPEVKLFPSATVRVNPLVEAKTDYQPAMFRPQWFVIGKDNPYWSSDLLAACGEHPRDGIFRDFQVKADKDNSFKVPAGVWLRIHLRGLVNIEWAPVTIADYLRLKPGQVYDAGRPFIGEPFKVFVEALDSAGKPVEGVPVVVCGDHDPAISSTGEDGLAYFDFVGYSKGEFIVECKRSDDANSPALRQTLDYEISGPEDANSVYTLRVSDEILGYLFK